MLHLDFFCAPCTVVLPFNCPGTLCGAAVLQSGGESANSFCHTMVVVLPFGCSGASCGAAAVQLSGIMLLPLTLLALIVVCINVLIVLILQLASLLR